MKAAHDEMTSLFPTLTEARRQYFISQSAEDLQRLEAAQEHVEALDRKFQGILHEMELASGLSAEELAALEAPAADFNRSDLARHALTADAIRSTHHVDETLANSVDAIKQLLPHGWLAAETAESVDLRGLQHPDAYLSLTKSLRRESEFPTIHRFRQAIFAAEQYLADDLLFDHFAGANLLTTLDRVARSFPYLHEVEGSGARIKRLWTGASSAVDATIFELLVASGCVEMGRDIKFIEETSNRSPDIRGADPFPLVIECKRQQAMTDYEMREEQIMKDLFERLRARAQSIGIYGTFRLELSVEAARIDAVEVVAAMISQRLVANPQTNTAHPWGSVALDALDRRVDFHETTRIYSPTLLEAVFDWTTDLCEWDGICCSYENVSETLLNEVIGPVALCWNNISEAAVQKRSWAPVNLFASAVEQIPPGEFGIVYIGVTEGARATIADQRFRMFEERLEGWGHRPGIRVPLILFSRLMPRPLGDGVPDVIENVAILSSKGAGELSTLFPTKIYTE